MLNLSIRNENRNLNNNYYYEYMEKLGMTREAWLIFWAASLLQFIWGCETCFIAINLEALAKHNQIPDHYASLGISLLYTMMGFGSLLVGTLTKHLGRINTLLITTLSYAILTITCSLFIHPLNFYYVLILRFFSNISLGVFNIVNLNLMSEFLPVNNRSLVLMINSGFYNVGNVFLILLNYFFVTSITDNQYTFQSNNWRIVNLLTSIPAILSFFIVLFYIHESPLYLLNKNKEEEAFQIMEIMSKEKLDEKEKTKIKNSVIEKKNYSLKSDYKELFLPEYFSLTINSLLICMISYFNMIGISYLVPKAIKELGQSKTFNLSYYEQLMIYGTLQLPNGFIGGWMTESKFFGRKRTIWFSSLMCAVFYLFSYIWPRYMCFYAGEIMLFNSIAYGAAYIYVTEAFPTNIRDQAQSLIQFFSFLLGSWSPYLINTFDQHLILYNFIILGMTCVICAFITFFLPFETQNRPLDEDYELNK